jgi:teichuronic acid biosynthesis protein TuaF
MSLFENESIKRIVTRFKKLFLVLLLLPVLFAGIGYFIGMNQETTSTAKAEIMLGDFKNTEFNDVGTVQENLKSERYLQSLKDEYNLNYNASELAGKTNPTYRTGKVIELSYTTENKEDAERVLQELVNKFVKKSNKAYYSQKNDYEEAIARVEGTTNEDSILELVKVKTDLKQLRPTQIHKDVSVDETSNNPMRKAILGFLVGLMFSISLLLFPEAIRK